MQTLICSLNLNDFDPEPPVTIHEVLLWLFITVAVAIPFILMIEAAR